MNPTAEELLAEFQKVLVETTPANGFAGARRLESTYGSHATTAGRRLQDLLTGTYAWNLFERPRSTERGLPRLHELSRCGPLLRVMRESGELDERERLHAAREAALVAIWRDPSLTDLNRRTAAEDIDEQYRANIERVAAAYRPHYLKLRRATGSVQPLIGPRVRSRPLLLPPALTHFYAACHVDKETGFEPDETHGLCFRHGRNSTMVDSIETLDNVDEMAWDITAIAVSAFFVRTAGSDPDAAFPLVIDDYFDWRGVDPRKRTVELRKQIDARLQLLFSDRLKLHAEMDIWLAEPISGRRSKTALVSDGSILVRRSGLYRLTAWLSEVTHQPLYGYMVSLGPWAKRFVEERAMIGIFPKKLAEYDLRRQQWERRIGWYLTFQMHAQGSHMEFQEIDGDLHVKPQHPLRMRTVLTNSHVRWEEMARTNPGKVIKQWGDALDRLRADGVIGRYDCLDGAVDGADLPVRSRLATMLEYRFEFTPGGDVLEHIRAKSDRRRNRVHSRGGRGTKKMPAVSRGQDHSD